MHIVFDGCVMFLIDVLVQGDATNVIKRGSLCLFSCHNTDKYGYFYR